MKTTTTTKASFDPIHWAKLALACLFLSVGAAFALSFVTAQAAFAADVPPGIQLEQSNGSSFSIGQPAPNSGGGWSGGSGGGGGVADPLKRSIYGKCVTVSAGNVCTTESIIRGESTIYDTRQECPAWTLKKNGTVIATGGPAAQRRLLAEAAPLWNNFNAAEIMANRLSNREWDPSNPASPTWSPNPVQMPTYAQLPFSYYRAAVQAPYQFSQGPCRDIYFVDKNISTRSSIVCPPTSRNSYYPAAVGAVSFQTNRDTKKVGPYTNKSWQEDSYTCVYVKITTPPKPEPWYTVTCYHTVTYSLYTSESRSVIANNGTRVGSTYRSPTPTPAVLSGDKKSLSNCSQTFNNNWNTNLDQYGYYRIQGDHLGTGYQVYKWPAWTGNPNVAEIRQLGTNPYSKRDYYTYSCNGPTPVEKWGAYGNLPAQGARTFSESRCPQVTWQCQVNGTVDIAGTHAAATVMRDGRNVTVRLPGLAVTGTGVRDVSGAGAVQDASMDYRLTVNSGVSPVSPSSTDPNFDKQYYKLWKADGKTSERFGQWFAGPNANRDKFLSWIWASDTNKTWSMYWDARFDAQFYVPRSTGIGPNGGTGTSLQWVAENDISCPTATTQQSNKITVVRSINNSQ